MKLFELISRAPEYDSGIPIEAIGWIFAIIFIAAALATIIFIFKVDIKETKRLYNQYKTDNNANNTQSGNKCITCGADAGEDKLCPACKQKLEAEGLIDQDKKCALCGENSGGEKLCRSCRQKLTDADIEIGHKHSAEPPQQIIINNEPEEKRSGRGSCCLYTLAALGVVFILLIIGIILAGKAMLDMITEILPFLK